MVAKVFGVAALDSIADAVKKRDAERVRQLLARHPDVLRANPRESADILCLAIQVSGHRLNLLSDG